MCDCDSDCNCTPYGYKPPSSQRSRKDLEREVAAARQIMIQEGDKNVPSLEKMMERYTTTEE